MIPGTHKKLMTGMETWDNRNGALVVRLHWSADPDKTEEWADRTSTKYGGRLSKYWRQEYEIDFGAGRGGLVFPQFSVATHCPEQLTPKEMADWPKWRFIDPGYNHACAVGWFTIHDKCLIQYREYRAQMKSVGQIAPDIKALSVGEKYQFTMIGHDAFAHTLAGSGKTVADLFVENGIAVNPAPRCESKSKQIYALAELMVLQEHGEPRFKVTQNCENMIRELMGYRWKEATDGKPQPDEPIKIDDDHVDCGLMACQVLDPETAVRTPRDELERWYDGRDRRRIRADERRMRYAVQTFTGVEQEP